jgi:hypothetical protein
MARRGNITPELGEVLAICIEGIGREVFLLSAIAEKCGNSCGNAHGSASGVR